MRGLFNSLLIVMIGVLAYMCVMSILDPIHFTEEKEKRDDLVKERLMNIRKAQIEYQKTHQNEFANSFASLVDYVKNGKLLLVKKEGVLSDYQLESGLTEEMAVKIVKKGDRKEIEAKGLTNFSRDTIYVSVLDSLFGSGFIADSLPYVPGTRDTFELKTGSMKNVSGYIIKLFEAKTPYRVYLNGLNEQEIINLIDRDTKLDKFPGLQVGSVEEANNNAGNWE